MNDQTKAPPYTCHGGFQGNCESDDDCELTDCMGGATGCGCKEDIGICLPTCSDDSDCPETPEGDPMTCLDGFCEPPMGE